jgi:hypothetical protein
MNTSLPSKAPAVAGAQLVAGKVAAEFLIAGQAGVVVAQRYL